jgi:hypothetical protein
MKHIMPAIIMNPPAAYQPRRNRRQPILPSVVPALIELVASASWALTAQKGEQSARTMLAEFEAGCIGQSFSHADIELTLKRIVFEST